jgi:hypothetical protein
MSTRERRGIALGAGLAVIVAIVIGVLAVLGLLPGLNGGSPAVAQFPPRPYTTGDFWPGEQGVLHVEGPRGEMWFDPRRGRARIEQRSGDGGLLTAAAVDGEIYWEYRDAGYMEGGGYRGDAGYLEIVRRTAPDAAWNWWVSLNGSYVVFHPAVREGELKTLLETKELTRNGQSVLEVKVPFVGEGGSVEKMITVYLDPLSGLPADSVSEWLASETVDSALFAPPEDLPPLRTITRDIQMTMEEARQFKGFDIYYLGSTALDWPLLGLFEIERSYGADWSDPEEWPPTRYVRAVYGLRGGLGQPEVSKVSINSWPDEFVKAPWEEDPPMPRPGSPGRQVTVAGVPGILFETPGETMLWFQLGDTVISIAGEDSQQVLSAAESLEKLN